MAVTINGTSGVTFPAGGVGNPAGTVVGTSDSQTLTSKTLTSPTMTTPTIDSAQIPTVSGTAPIYMCRAWCNFNSSGSNIASLVGGNVSSVTYNSTGVYTANFTTAMPDTSFSTSGSAVAGTFSEIWAQGTRATTSVQFSLRGTNGQAGNATQVSLIVMR